MLVLRQGLRTHKARAKGLEERVSSSIGMLLRNALIPLVTLDRISHWFLVGGNFFIEVPNIPGIGQIATHLRS